MQQLLNKLTGMYADIFVRGEGGGGGGGGGREFTSLYYGLAQHFI